MERERNIINTCIQYMINPLVNPKTGKMFTGSQSDLSIIATYKRLCKDRKLDIGTRQSPSVPTRFSQSCTLSFSQNVTQSVSRSFSQNFSQRPKFVSTIITKQTPKTIEPTMALVPEQLAPQHNILKEIQRKRTLNAVDLAVTLIDVAPELVPIRKRITSFVDIPDEFNSNKKPRL
jgi:hypothetical protein